MNISSLQVVRSQRSPFASDPMFRYFFGDQMARAAGLAESRLRRGRVERRLHPHQQPRRRRRARPGVGRHVRQARAQGEDHRHRRVDRPGAAQDRGARPAGAAVGGLRQAQGRRVGPRGRQPVPVEPDRHARHRLGARPQPRRQRRDLRRLHPDRRGHQSGQLGRRARQRARRAHRHQHGDLQRIGRLPGQSGSPSRATWRAT